MMDDGQWMMDDGHSSTNYENRYKQRLHLSHAGSVVVVGVVAADQMFYSVHGQGD